MSYILDALKKIEHEKLKKVSTDGRVSITGDLFHERKRPAGRSGLWKMALLLAVAVLVACAGTWFVLREDSRKNSAVTRQDVSAPPLVAAPVVPAPVPVQAVQVPPIQPALPGKSPAAPRQSTDAGQVGSNAPPRTARFLNQEQPQRTPSSLPKQVAPTVSAPADIKLSGIAWQDERSGRRAVINGFLLKEGAVVSGARITDIQADRVRFSTAAGVFEIRLDAVLPSEVKK